MRPLQVFLGYDPRETVSWHVLAHSIYARASKPVSVSPINLSNLRGIYSRPANTGQTTEFTFARFLTPWLSGFETSIFMDCDMLCRCDIWELAELAAQNRYADVLCVKHKYEPSTSTKFLGQKQSRYPKKNWSSVMVFNGHRAAVHRLTPEYVNRAEPMNLHQFEWAADVGALPVEFNHLVGEYLPNPDAKIVHYTLGGPWFPEFVNCEFANEWWDELDSMTYPANLQGVRDANLSRLRAAGANGSPEPDGLQRSGEDGDQSIDPEV